MAQSNDTYEVLCPFCGEINPLLKDELFDKDPTGKEFYREKFCLNCGENLTQICPTCNRGFRLDANFKDNYPLKILPTFWNPIRTSLDEIMPQLEKRVAEFHELGGKLSSEMLRRSHGEFLAEIPKFKGRVDDLFKFLEEAKMVPEIKAQLEGASKDVLKNLRKIQDEIADIIANIDPNTKLLKEKKEEKLKKHVPFVDEKQKDLDFITALKRTRMDQIEKEKEALKPGAKKLPQYVQQDPSFFRLKCPSCTTVMFNINKQMYLQDPNTKQLKFIKSLEQGPVQEKQTAQSSNIRLNFTLIIVKDGDKQLHGKINFSLPEGASEIVGRTLIREADYIEPDAEDVLYDEADPLQYVSNSQFALERINGKIMIKGREYDADRPGVYLNTMEHDVRKLFPNGSIVNNGDLIIIPLNTEDANPNKIEMKIEF
jgi:hypothetical protein